MNQINYFEQMQIEQRLLIKSFVYDFVNVPQEPKDFLAWMERFDNHLKRSIEGGIRRYVDLLGSNGVLVDKDVHEKIMAEIIL